MEFHASEVPVEPDHLLPEESPCGPSSFLFEYHLRASAVLFKSRKPKWKERAAVVCLPSFQPEWVVRLIDTGKGKHVLFLVEAAQQIYCSPTATIETKDSLVSLPEEVASTICTVWRQMLEQVRHPERARLGLDGASFHFTYWELGVGCMAGRTWSPSADLATGRLVAVAQSLREYTLAEEPTRQKVLEGIRRSLDWFQIDG